MTEEKITQRQLNVYRKLSGRKRLDIALGLSKLSREISEFGKKYVSGKRKRITFVGNKKT